MTREEAWNRIDAIIEKHEVDDVYVTINNHKDYDALRFARKLLEQESCKDAISRQAVLDLTGKSNWFESSDDYNDFVIAVCELPPVIPQLKTEKVIKMRDATPEERESIGKYIKSISKPTGVNFWNLDQAPKTGKWIYDKTIENWRCSECNEIPRTIGYVGTADFMAEHFRFCNHCGSRMR